MSRININDATPNEYKAIIAIVKYMRKPGTPKKAGKGKDFPDYDDPQSFIKAADEARTENELKRVSRDDLNQA